MWFVSPPQALYAKAEALFCKKRTLKQQPQYRSKSVSGALTVSQKAKNCQSEGQKLLVRTPLTENKWLTQEQESHANHFKTSP